MTSSKSSPNTPFNMYSSFEKLPMDIVLEISQYLSVQDLCRLKVVSTSFFSSFSNQHIWRSALNDILAIMPIANIRIDTQMPNNTDCMRLAIDLAKEELLLNKAEKYPTMLLERSSSNPHLLQRLLPGGSFYFRADDIGTPLLAIYDVFSDRNVLTFESPVNLSAVEITSFSPDHVLLATYSAKNVHERQYHANLYLCKPSSQKGRLVSQSPVFDNALAAIALTKTAFLVAWSDRGTFKMLFQHLDISPYIDLDDEPRSISQKLRLTQQPLWLEFISSNRMNTPWTVALASDFYFILGDYSGQHLFRIPRQSTNDGSLVSMCPLWSTPKLKHGSWRVPRIVTSPNHNPTDPQPPSTFAIWDGKYIVFVDRVDLPGGDCTEPVFRTTSLVTGHNPMLLNNRAPFVSSTLAIDPALVMKKEDSKSYDALRFVFATEEARMLGNMRLGRPLTERLRMFDLQLWKLIDSRPIIAYDISYDEESGRMLVSFRSQHPSRNFLVSYRE